MDYVYICRDGENEELRYSIRSVVTNLPDGRIWLIGGKPDWYSGDYIPVENEKNKFYSINKCWKIISQSDEISEDFILMNDDFYILNKINNIPIMHGGLLKNKIDKYSDAHGHNKYSQILMYAHKKLIKSGIKDPLDYDIHTPMPLKKSLINEYVTSSMAPRSLYGNINMINGTFIEDVKVYGTKDNIEYSYNYNNLSSDYLSSIDSSFKTLGENILFNMFKEKTKYEK